MYTIYIHLLTDHPLERLLQIHGDYVQILKMELSIWSQRNGVDPMVAVPVIMWLKIPLPSCFSDFCLFQRTQLRKCIKHQFPEIKLKMFVI